ncbi:MAG TPA: hypothetical protein VF460_05560 [Burkholderiales bacterium]
MKGTASVLRRLVFVVSLLAFDAAGGAGAAAGSAPADSLRAAYEELHARLADNAYGKPLHLDSREGTAELKGDIHAVVAHPFDVVQGALSDPGGWCDILLLQFNTKRCEATGIAPPVLAINIGRKHDQPLEKTVRVEFPFLLRPATKDYFSVVLNAPAGPYGTRDYRILLEAVPLEKGSTFIHLSYSYGFGITAKLATHTYLATAGRAKAGFTVVGTNTDGRPQYVGGVRGMIERNTMRYYLAIETHLNSLSVPAGTRIEKRLNDWFDAIERYPRQLHEMERDDYLAMKRREIRRQQG